MKKNFLLVCTFLFISLPSLGCMLDLTEYGEGCRESYQADGGIVYMAHGCFPPLNLTLIGCRPNLNFWPYNDPYTLCLNGFYTQLFKVCHDSEPQEVRNKLVPQITADSCGSIVQVDK